jgi:hypothetical protein
MMMHDERVYELSRLYIEERIAGAARERLLAECGQARNHVSEVAAWGGRLLVRVGRRLETLGGASPMPRPVEMRQRPLSHI